MAVNSFAAIKEQVEYLDQRGFTQQQITKSGIQICPDASTLDALGFPKKFTAHIEKAILLPIFNLEGEIADYTARVWYKKGFVDNPGPKLLCRADTSQDRPASVHFSPLSNWSKLEYGTRIFICESVLKAETVARLGFHAIGVNGCWGFSKEGMLHWDLKKLEWKALGLKPVLFMDSNVNENNAQLKGVAPKFRAFMELECGVEAEIIHLPRPSETDDWGCDDYLMKYGEPVLRALLVSEAAPIIPALVEYYKRMNKEVVLVRESGQIYQRRLRKPMGVGHFQVNYADWKHWDNSNPKKPRYIPIANNWLEWPGRSVVDMEIYAPGQPEFYEDNGYSYYNPWAGMGCEPMEGDPGPFLEWVHDAFPLEMEREWLLNYLSWPIQNLGQKMNSALVLVGPSGTGKGFLAEAMLQIYGSENYWKTHFSSLENDFNAGLARAQIVIVEENDQNKRKVSDKVYNRLKDMVTSQQIRLERKGVDAVMRPTRANYIIESNYIDTLPIEKYDRRFCVLEITNKSLENNIAYFNPKWEWLWGDGKKILHWYFLHRELSGFDSKAPPPLTEAKLKMRETTESNWEKWVQDNILDNTEEFIYDIGGEAHYDRAMTAKTLLFLAEGPDYNSGRVASFGRCLVKMGVKKALTDTGKDQIKVAGAGNQRYFVLRGSQYSEVGWQNELKGSSSGPSKIAAATAPATKKEKF